MGAAADSAAAREAAPYREAEGAARYLRVAVAAERATDAQDRAGAALIGLATTEIGTLGQEFAIY